MTGVQVTIKVNEKDMKKVQRKLRQVLKEVGNAYPANLRIGIRLARWVSENFETEGGKVGGWKPFKYGGRLLSKKKRKQSPYRGGMFTAQSIEGHRYVDPTAELLRDTHALEQSFVPYKATSDKVIIGSHITYSVYHEYGVPQRKLPARRMLPRGSDKDVIKMILKIYDDYIYQVTGK